MKKYKIKAFIKGMGSVFNFWGGYYNYKIKSDYEALKDDWEKVGDDLRKAMNNFNNN